MKMHFFGHLLGDIFVLQIAEQGIQIGFHLKPVILPNTFFSYLKVNSISLRWWHFALSSTRISWKSHGIHSPQRWRLWDWYPTPGQMFNGIFNTNHLLQITNSKENTMHCFSLQCFPSSTDFLQNIGMQWASGQGHFPTAHEVLCPPPPCLPQYVCHLPQPI